MNSHQGGKIQHGETSLQCIKRNVDVHRGGKVPEDLKMYSLFLEMLFGNRNGYFRGLDDVRRKLMGMARVKETITPSYYANVIWAILNDMAKHFNECMSIDNFVEGRIDDEPPI